MDMIWLSNPNRENYLLLLQMGRLFLLLQGLWTKSDNGVWSFEEIPDYQRESLIINKTDSFEGLIERIRITLNLGIFDAGGFDLSTT